LLTVVHKLGRAVCRSERALVLFLEHAVLKPRILLRLALVN